MAGFYVIPQIKLTSEDPAVTDTLAHKNTSIDPPLAGKP